MNENLLAAEFQASVRRLSERMVRRGIYPEWTAIDKARAAIKRKWEIKTKREFERFFSKDERKRYYSASRKEYLYR